MFRSSNSKFLCAVLFAASCCAEAQAGTVAFTDGNLDEPYTGNNLVAGASFVWAVGRFALTADANGETLSQVKVRLDGVRTGSVSFGLAVSSNGNDTYEYGFDTGLSSAVSDPGDGGEATFNLSYAIPASTKRYFFITGVANSGSHGTVRAYIDDATKISFADASTLSPAPNNSALSTNAPSVPVRVSAFTID
jgi:hypothetical protein